LLGDGSEGEAVEEAVGFVPIRKIGLDLTYSNSMLKWSIILKKYVVVLKLI